VGVGLTFVNFRGCFKPFCSLGAHGTQNNRTRRGSGKPKINNMKKLELEKMTSIEGGKTCFAEGLGVLAAMESGSFLAYLAAMAALAQCLQ
jgi:hypothetical protein